MDLARIKALELENDKVYKISAQMATLRDSVSSSPVADDEQPTMGCGSDLGDGNG